MTDTIFHVVLARVTPSKFVIHHSPSSGSPDRTTMELFTLFFCPSSNDILRLFHVVVYELITLLLACLLVHRVNSGSQPVAKRFIFSTP